MYRFIMIAVLVLAGSTALLLGCTIEATDPYDGDTNDTGDTGDTGASCPQTSHGSCTAADGTCEEFTGSFWASGASQFCNNDLSSCDCDRSDATGSCTYFIGTINETLSWCYDNDVTTVFLDCLDGGQLNKWESTASTPDLTWVCLEHPASWTSSGNRFDTCGKEWDCDETAIKHSVECEYNVGNSTFDCDCLIDGVVTASYSDDDACGVPTMSRTEYDEVITNAAKNGCSWQVSDDSSI